MRLIYIFFLFVLLLGSNIGFSQDTKFNIRAEKEQVVAVLKEIEANSNYRFFYIREQVDVERFVNIRASNATLQEILDELFKGKGVSYQIMDNYLVLLSPDNYSFEKAIPEIESFVVSGHVSDEIGQELPGVSVVIKGTNRGTFTDSNGNFSLSGIQDGETLIFSFVGKYTLEKLVKGQHNLNITLVTDDIGIEEVVAIGYGVQRKIDVTGAVGLVTRNTILEKPAFNALQGLKGKVAGVTIFSNSGSPSGSTRVIIRGINSIETTSDPLYVVDGVAMENFNLLNPNDIESIEVLKDASSAAIYGARGANGVILVTTKRGVKNNQVVMKYNGYISVGRIRKKMDVLNSKEWLEVIKEGYVNAPKYKDYSDDNIPSIDFTDPRLFDAEGNPLYDTDWQDESMRTSISHSNQISFQQGNEKSSTGVFLNYSDIQGIMLNSWMKRMYTKIAFDASPKEWLDFGFNILLNRTSENEIDENGGYQMPRRTMIEFVPIMPVKFPDGTWSSSSSTNNFALEGMSNPVHVLTTQERLRYKTQMFGNSYLNFRLSPYLQLKTQFGSDYHFDKNKNYSPKDLLNISFPNGSASIGNYQSMYWQEETFLNYEKEFKKLHRISSVLGMSWQERIYEFNVMSAQGFSDDFLKYNNMGSATYPNALSSGYERWAMNSYFFRFGYTNNNKYLATFTVRADGSSRFGKNNKFGFFPSAGFGWILSNEDFLKNKSSLDFLKLRTSFGVTGNTELGTYRSLATVSSGTVLLDNERAGSSEITKLPNPGLSWEKTAQFDIGANLVMFKQMLNVELDYYYKLTSDLLLARPVPHSSGFSSVMDNIGAVSNKGFDVLLTLNKVQNVRLPWVMTLNFNYNKNRIEKLGKNNEDIFPGPMWVSGSQTILRVGESLGSFWGYKRLGVWGTDEVAEAAAVGAVPGVAKRSAEKEIIGNGLADVTGSLSNKFYFGNFDVLIDLQFSFGADILQQFLHSIEDRTGYANGLKTILYDGWTETNQNTMVQQIRNAPLNGQNTEVDDYWVANGSYVRGNLISVGYTLNKNMLKKIRLSVCRFYATLDNSFVIHSKEFKGYDPEATSWNGNQWGQNIVFFQYPKPTSFSIGTEITF